MIDPFRGYVRTHNKRPCQKFGSGEALLTLSQAEGCHEYAGILNGSFTVKDMDDVREADKLYRLICDLDLNCRVMKTTRGMQFFFKSSPWVTKNLTHVIDALGFEFDTRTGKNAYSVLKFDGRKREILRNFDEDRPASEYPACLAPLTTGVKFTGMGEGSGRNGALFQHTARLLKAGFPKEQVRKICTMINRYVFDDPLPKEELDKILRDETFDNFESTSSEFRQILRPPDFSDTGMATVFARESAARLRYCSACGWLVYSGTVWEISDLKAQQQEMDFTGKVLTEAIGELKAAYQALALAETAGDDDANEKAKAKLKDAQSYHKFALKMRTYSKVVGVLKLASSTLEIDINELDADAFALNTPIGIIDLKTGALSPHTPESFCTKITHTSPGAGGKELWQECLDGVTGGDEEFQSFLQHLAGAMAIGRVYHEALVIAHGDGANGKSTFFNTIATVLGDYAGKIPAEALTTKAKSVKVDLAELVGKRFVLASETEEGQRLSVSMLKQIASVDTITGERKFHDPFTFTPTHTAVLYTNHLPKVGSGDLGTWRRLVVAPFTQKIARPQTDFAERLLKQSGGAVLSWIITGAKKYIDSGCRLPSCKAIESAAKEYRENNDWFGTFLSECCKVGSDQETPSGELYRCYRQWALSQGEYVRSTTDFSTALKNAGFEWSRTNRGRIWSGLSLISDFLEEEEVPF